MELNIIIDDSDWEDSWEEWHKCLNSPNWREYSWKLRMRFFKTPIIMASYNNNVSALCWRKCGQIVDLSHIFWECPVVKHFWDKVTAEIKKILNLNTQLKIYQVILCGAIHETWDKDKRYMFKVLLLIAHKLITINWLKPHSPTLEQWTQRLKVVNCMEDITSILRLRRDNYLKKWSSVISYLEKT